MGFYHPCSLKISTASILGFICLLSCFVGLEANGSRPHKVLKTITVDHAGYGNFKSVQSAIDSIPSENDDWVCIRIASGVYREKVTVDKPYLVLKGSGRRNTKIVWGDHENLQQSATLTVVTDNFAAKGISFINSHNLPGYRNGKNARVPASAAYISGDKCSFYRCGFYGVQDTLWDVNGRHYFFRTTIVGSVDYIFGNGQSIYEKCIISVLGGVLDPGTAGFITSQGRASSDETSGFVFKECSIIGGGQAYLGRPWASYARVLFYGTSMSNIIVPQGWNAWQSSGQENKLTFAEHNCMGPGANKTGRVNWEKTLSGPEIHKFTSISYINSDKWLQEQPVNFI